MQLPFDIFSSMLLESASIFTSICCLRTNSNCSRIASASSNSSAKAITSADSTKRATRRDLYDLYETGIALWYSSVKTTKSPSCDDESALLENAASLFAIILYDLLSSLGTRMDSMWLCTYLISLFKHFQCVLISFSYMVRIACAICEISRTMSGLVFASYASFILMEANLLNWAPDGICSILLI